MLSLLLGTSAGSIYYKAAHLPNPAQLKDVQNVMGVIYSSTSFLGEIQAALSAITVDSSVELCRPTLDRSHPAAELARAALQG